MASSVAYRTQGARTRTRGGRSAPQAVAALRVRTVGREGSAMTDCATYVRCRTDGGRRARQSCTRKRLASWRRRLNAMVRALHRSRPRPLPGAAGPVLQSRTIVADLRIASSPTETARGPQAFPGGTGEGGACAAHRATGTGPHADARSRVPGAWIPRQARKAVDRRRGIGDARGQRRRGRLRKGAASRRCEARGPVRRRDVSLSAIERPATAARLCTPANRRGRATSACSYPTRLTARSRMRDSAIRAMPTRRPRRKRSTS